MQEYANTESQRPSSRPKSQDPVLTPEDEAFLRNIMAEQPAQTPTDGPLSPVSPLEPGSTELHSPVSPVEEFGRELGEQERKAHEPKEQTQDQPAKAESSSQPEKKWRPWNWIRKKSNHEKKVSRFDAHRPVGRGLTILPLGQARDAQREPDEYPRCNYR